MKLDIIKKHLTRANIGSILIRTYLLSLLTMLKLGGFLYAV